MENLASRAAERAAGTSLARERLREFGLALAVAAAGALGALPRGAGAEAGRLAPGALGSDPLALLVWLSLAAAPAGFALAALGVRFLPYGLVPPGLWMGALALSDALSPRDLPAPLWSALAWSGLFTGGYGLGRLAPGGAACAWRGAGALLLAAALLAALPGGGGLARAPFPPPVASLLLDLSPATLVIESAGVDWMRHPAVYGPVGTDRFQRRAWRGELAGPAALLVGCALAAGASRRRRRRPTEEE